MKRILLLLCIVASVARAADFRVMSTEVNASVEIAHTGVPGPRPVHGAVCSLEFEAFSQRISSAPLHRLDMPLVEYGARVSLPSPEGLLIDCAIARSPVMAPALAEKFKEIQTFIIVSLDQTAWGRFEVSPRGLSAMLRTERGAWMIDPWQSADSKHVISYYQHDLRGGDWTCETREGEHGFGTPEASSFAPRMMQPLRTLRLAVACTGEYGLYHCQIQNRAPNTADPLAAIVTVVSRANVVFENDLAVRFELVANNDLLIFTDPDTDPYATTCDGVGGTNCSGPHLATNISLLSNVIGNANFDVGHLVTRIYGGVAYLSSVCGNNKAGGISGIPRGGDLDPFAPNVVIHELGHQFGANHTFSGSRGRCAGNVRLASAWEAGSGSSPLAYAGACPVGDTPPSDNIVRFADPFFHHGSFGEMRTFISNITCPAQSATSNVVPEILSTTASTPIPPGTPFTLSATATDANNDPLTFSWEQFDSGVARPLSGPGSEDNGMGSLFRIFPPGFAPSRTFPKMSDILAGVPTPGEQLPTATGFTRRFRVIVRDNFAGAGAAVVSSFVNLSIPAGTSAFAVTSPTEGSFIRSGLATITWSVGGTNAPPISCSTVTIRLSTDDGETFPLVLANTANSGTANVMIPATPTSSARVRIDPDTGIFFAISRPFTIELPCAADLDDGSGLGTPDGGVTIDDLLYYIHNFDLGLPGADLDDGSGAGQPDGGVTIDDLLYYLFRFDSGC